MSSRPNFPSRSLASTSDLVVLAPWKPGIVEADDLVSYRTRLALTFRTLFELRRAAREASRVTVFSDPIERLEQIHSFRIQARDEGMLLAVTYDHQWDSYMTALHQHAGPFLDLLLINCAGYRTTSVTSRNEWARWVRAHEVPSDYFYAASALTVPDLLGRRRHRGEGDGAAPGAAATEPIRTPVELAAEMRRRNPEEMHRQALRALVAMYRLTRLHGADSVADGPLRDDARTLHAATRLLLKEWERGSLPQAIASTLEPELEWFDQVPPKLAGSPGEADTRACQGDVQRGLLSGFDGPISHGAMLLLRVTDAGRARQALAGVQLATEDRRPPQDGVFRTLAFSANGLRQLAIPEQQIGTLSEAFRQGAAARAGQVGDLRNLNPAHWRLPRRRRPDGSTETVWLETVDAVLILRTAAPMSEERAFGKDRKHPLSDAVAQAQRLPGIDLMHVEPLGPAYPGRPGVDHLGFQDGISQPDLHAEPGINWSDRVPEGALLIGPGSDADTSFHGGAYLAIRHVALHADRLQRLVAAAAKACGLNEVELSARMVGRRSDGSALVPHSAPNDFDYRSDPRGAMCPRQSHVRRANPREGRSPRIMRRGMSFGPPAGTGDGRRRGSLFMASCADLAEQYEVLLRWLNGDNSSRLPSWASCPLTGPADEERGRTFSLELNGQSFHVPLDADGPVAELDWSLYALVPPVSFVRSLGSAPPPGQSQPDRGALVRQGNDIIARLGGILPKQQREAEWRAALRDPGNDRDGGVRALWAAVNADAKNPGVRRTQVGVLVGSRELVLEVLRDDGRRFSVHGAGDRIEGSIGGFHLGWNTTDERYGSEAGVINDAIRAVSEAEAFAITRQACRDVLKEALRGDHDQPVSIDLLGGLLETVTARSFPAWFDLPDGHFIRAGREDWRCIRDRGPNLPGDYWSASRHAFIPLASAATGERAGRDGPALIDATTEFLKAAGRDSLKGGISARLAADRHAFPTDRELARALTGAIMGAIATTLGNGARIIGAWAASGALQRLAMDWRSCLQQDHALARQLFGARAEAELRHRPVPDQLWRIVAQDGLTLGTMKLRKGEVLVLGMQAVASEEAQAGAAAHVSFGMSGQGVEPPHGCPGRTMALGMILGWLAGIMDTADVRPSSAPASLDLLPVR